MQDLNKIAASNFARIKGYKVFLPIVMFIWEYQKVVLNSEFNFITVSFNNIAEWKVRE